ncbi:MAG TPA: alpha/beta fold hydrolase [Nitrososphaeraceae archaeon]|nr:alpha/beta fold hydrolase [Nitrososphaeraceae archaeon]
MVNTNRIVSSTVVVALFVSLMIVSNSISSNETFNLSEMVYGQSSNTTSNNDTSNDSRLPVLLIHGYMADASVWNKWVDLLKKDGISAYPITFKQSDDKCGSSAEHAKELSKIIGQIKDETGQNKVNIVGHSKGGLDARVYLANDTKDVANLVMIGTPNAGSPLAQSSEVCTPAVYDLRPGAAATEVKMNPNTKYYTIAGEWDPKLGNCQLSLFAPMEQSGSSTLSKPNDGIVPLSSVESQEYFINLGHSKSCHTNLMSDYEYGLAKEVIVEGSSSNQTAPQSSSQPQQQPQQPQQQETLKGSQQQGNENSDISLDLTTPSASGSLNGGDKKGSLQFSVQDNNLVGTAEMKEQPTDGKVYEGWFEDKGDASGYSLSVGKFDNNTLTLNQTMVNPYTYTVFFVTSEPVDDPDPNPSDVVVGTNLPIPFGQ